MTLSHFARLVLVGAALLLAPLPGSGAFAQTGPIRFIVGLAPGGAVDPYARIIAEHMAKTLDRSIIVENRPGATGNISAQFMIDAPNARPMSFSDFMRYLAGGRLWKLPGMPGPNRCHS